MKNYQILVWEDTKNTLSTTLMPLEEAIEWLESTKKWRNRFEKKQKSDTSFDTGRHPEYIKEII